jgi:hypothetical protein
MKYSKWIGLFAVLLLVFASFQPWVYIAAQQLTITGMNTTGTNFGKPALVNIIISALAAICFLVRPVMAKRANVFICTLNIAWAVRNYIILSICRAGECPEKKISLYLVLVASIVMLIASLFPDVTIRPESEDQSS